MSPGATPSSRTAADLAGAGAVADSDGSAGPRPVDPAALSADQREPSPLRTPVVGAASDGATGSTTTPAAAGGGDESGPDAELPTEHRPARGLRALALAALLVPQAVLVLVQGAAPLLLREAPLLLLALYPFQPWSLLVSSRTDPVVFVAVIVAVRTVPCWGGYFVGRWYGIQALDRLSRGKRSARATRIVVRVWAKAGGLLLIVYPGATSSVLAGAAAMPLRRFVPLMLTGLLLSAVLTRFIADSASEFVTAAADRVDEYAVPLGLVLLAGVVVTQLVNRRRARR